jgi:4-diphosphocytidyl-2-C-methyl-D-erythritol kinase
VSAVTVRVPAKVNVQLTVGGRRPDGFHDLANVFLAVGLYDHVTAAPGEGLRITAEGQDVERVPLDGTNLAARAAVALAKRYGVEPDVHLHIDKAIPVAGGMAGGSADAAGALVACDALWGLGASREELLGLCAELGSDVPFSLVGGAALGLGRGERLTPLTVGGDFHWVFAVAEGGLSTPEVYRECDRLRRAAGGSDLAEDLAEPAADPEVVAALAAGDAGRLAGALTNDLEGAAVGLRPGLAEVLRVGRERGALAGVVSGSGPTCAFLVGSAEEGVGLARALPGRAYPALAPAGGAAVV